MIWTKLKPGTKERAEAFRETGAQSQKKKNNFATTFTTRWFQTPPLFPKVLNRLPPLPCTSVLKLECTSVLHTWKPIGQVRLTDWQPWSQSQPFDQTHQSRPPGKGNTAIQSLHHSAGDSEQSRGMKRLFN